MKASRKGEVKVMRRGGQSMRMRTHTHARLLCRSPSPVLHSSLHARHPHRRTKHLYLAPRPPATERVNVGTDLDVVRLIGF